jgi:hypothetical protein
LKSKINVLKVPLIDVFIPDQKMKAKFIVLKKEVVFCCVWLLFFCTTSFSQIVYTDIPDATPNATYSLDLNNDTLVDYIIHFGGSGSSIGVICTPQNSNAYSGNFVGGTYLPWALTASNSICAELNTWYDATHPGTMGMGATIGYWPEATDKYLALQLIVGTQTYYGWARLDFLAQSGSFTIKDYAYESTPNTCILSGQTHLGNIENQSKDYLSIYPNPFNSSTTIQTIGTLNNAHLTLYNSYGQIVKQQTHLSGGTISISREELPSGIYYIRLTADNKNIAAEKLIITD